MQAPTGAGGLRAPRHQRLHRARRGLGSRSRCRSRQYSTRCNNRTRPRYMEFFTTHHQCTQLRISAFLAFLETWDFYSAAEKPIALPEHLMETPAQALGHARISHQIQPTAFSHLFPSIILSFNTQFLTFRACNSCGPLRTIQVFSQEHPVSCFSVKGRKCKIVSACPGQLNSIPGALTWIIQFIGIFWKNLLQREMLLKKLPLFLCREQLSRASTCTSSYSIHKVNAIQARSGRLLEN